MTKKNLTYNSNLIKSRRTYTFKEIAEVYQIHLGTIHAWHKKGLMPIDSTSKPFLFVGAEIIRFLKEKQKKRKHPLKIGECFCAPCRTTRNSLPDKILIQITTKRLGENARQAFFRGICEVCGRRLTRFSSDLQIKNMINDNLLPMEHQAALFGDVASCLNTDILRSEKNENQSEK